MQFGCNILLYHFHCRNKGCWLVNLCRKPRPNLIAAELSEADLNFLDQTAHHVERKGMHELSKYCVLSV